MRSTFLLLGNLHIVRGMSLPADVCVLECVLVCALVCTCVHLCGSAIYPGLDLDIHTFNC